MTKLTLMKNKAFFFLSIIIVFFLFASIIHPISVFDTPSNNQIELKKVLQKCAEYCERLSNSVLYFVCQERIEEVAFLRDRTSFGRKDWAVHLRSTYVYDYQLIRKDGKIKEKRILIEENGRKKHEENAQLKTKFLHENLILGPIGLLSKQRQQYYDYKIIEEKKFKGEEALIIEAVPISLHTLSLIYGKIWIRKSDFGILKIEWEQTSIEKYERIEKRAKALKAKPRITIITEYSFDKKGIRFPSKNSFKEGYIRMGRKFLLSETTVEYKNYKFFTVETKIIY